MEVSVDNAALNATAKEEYRRMVENDKIVR